MVTVVEKPWPTAQEAIEARYHAREGKAPGEAPGDIGQWTFAREGHRWLMSPATGRWFIHDRVHGTWEPTGFGAGEVVFSVVHSVPVARRISRDPGPDGTRENRPGPGRHVAGALVCRACGTTNGEGSRFCRKCGAGLSPAGTMRYCGMCGKPTLPGTSFCRFCGKRIET